MAKWIIDESHSEVGFKVKHLMITSVKGNFKKYNAEAETEGDELMTAKISFTADTASVDTGSEQRDQHLRSGDFFDSENYRQLIFRGTKYENTPETGHYILHGDLTIKNITKPVKLNVEQAGVMQDPWGNTKAGFILTGKINRKEWELNWNAPLEAGGFLVSDDVTLNCEIQLTKQS